MKKVWKFFYTPVWRIIMTFSFSWAFLWDSVHPEQHDFMPDWIMMGLSLFWLMLLVTTLVDVFLDDLPPT